MRRENEHEPFLTVNAERWVPTVTTLNDLDHDDLEPAERDEICKRLSPDAQVALMARYGLPWRAEGGR